MDFLKQNKIAVGGGLVLVVAVLVYFTYFSGPSSNPTLTTTDTGAVVSQNLLVMLKNLHTITLDDSLFSDPAFQSLTNFGVIIPEQPVGRRNPFLPLSGGTGGALITIPKSGQ